MHRCKDDTKNPRPNSGRIAGLAGLRVLGTCDNYTSSSSGGAEKAAHEIYTRLGAAGVDLRRLSVPHPREPYDVRGTSSGLQGVDLKPARRWISWGCPRGVAASPAVSAKHFRPRSPAPTRFTTTGPSPSRASPPAIAYRSCSRRNSVRSTKCPSSLERRPGSTTDRSAATSPESERLKIPCRFGLAFRLRVISLGARPGR